MRATWVMELCVIVSGNKTCFLQLNCCLHQNALLVELNTSTRSKHSSQFQLFNELYMNSSSGQHDAARETLSRMMQHAIVDNFGHLSEPNLEPLSLPALNYELASFVECMRLVLFIFIITISISISEFTSSSLALFLDILCNLDQYFLRLVPITMHHNDHWTQPSRH